MNGNSGNPIMALEIETYDDEEESLMQETSEMDQVMPGKTPKELIKGFNSQNMRRRAVGEGHYDADRFGSRISYGRALIQGFVRSDLVNNAAYFVRNALCLGLMAVFVIFVLEWEGGILRSEIMDDVESTSPHEFTFGGKNNPGHKPSQVASANINPNSNNYNSKGMFSIKDDDDAIDNDDPTTNDDDYGLYDEDDYGGPWDLSPLNDMNENGHYWHDPLLSPFASHLYKEAQDTLDERQVDFIKRSEDVAAQWGQWQNPSHHSAKNLLPNFYDQYLYRDVPLEAFPEKVWQKDRDYITQFIDEAMAVVESVKEGIYLEYGHPSPGENEKEMFEVIIGDYVVRNGTAYETKTDQPKPGIAYIPQNAWDGLIQKLLHTMITTDHFYVVLVGTEEAYRANNFWKSQIMQFNYIMEPVMHKLGMKLISRNMAANASTLVGALGGADIYGETDILWHFQEAAAELMPGEFDLLQKQSILTGERVPIILTPNSDDLVRMTKGKAWVGNLQPGAEPCDITTTSSLPTSPACQYVRCDQAAMDSGKCDVYESVCWVERSDYTPAVTQDDNVGFQDMHYPNHRQHQWEGRKLSLLLLHALVAALRKWQEQMEEEDRTPLPLATQHWHISSTYIDIRAAVLDLTRVPGEEVKVPPCEVLMKNIDARICHLPMRAYTEWTPRVAPKKHRLLRIVENYIPALDETQPYDGIDILPLYWEVPSGETDVHMIAMAANITTEVEEELFENDDDGAHRRRTLRNRMEMPQDSYSSRTRKTEEATAAKKYTISPGKGWRIENTPIGFCDGSAQSRCNRQESNTCLLANYNHYKGSLVGTPKNGWLKMRVQGVKKGIILARLEFEPSAATSGLPDDLEFDYALNGLLQTVTAVELPEFGQTIVEGLTVYPLLIDPDEANDEFPGGMDYEISLRIRSEKDPECKLKVSHIYFAS